MAHSALLIPVPELESVVRPRLERRSPGYLPLDPEETSAHVTLLGPFAQLDAIDEGVLAELRVFFGDVTPFPFELTQICQFPGGRVYLSPESVSPLRQLAHELWRRFPEYPPFGAEFDDVVPHLSVPIPDGESLDTLRFELEPRLPITVHAREAALWWFEPDGCRTLATFGFAMTAA